MKCSRIRFLNLLSAHRIVFFILLLTALQSCAAPHAFLESDKNEMPQLVQFPSVKNRPKFKLEYNCIFSIRKEVIIIYLSMPQVPKNTFCDYSDPNKREKDVYLPEILRVFSENGLVVSQEAKGKEKFDFTLQIDFHIYIYGRDFYTENLQDVFFAIIPYTHRYGIELDFRILNLNRKVIYEQSSYREVNVSWSIWNRFFSYEEPSSVFSQQAKYSVEVAFQKAVNANIFGQR